MKFITIYILAFTCFFTAATSSAETNLNTFLSMHIVNLMPLAKSGVKNAQLALGIRYVLGSGAVRNYDEGIKWLNSESLKANKEALFYKGLAYEYKKDYAKALDLYNLAAKQGFAPAITKIGQFHLSGTGVPKDYDEAIKWFNKAKDSNDVDALYYIGLMHELGKGFNKSYDEALTFYDKAISLGCTHATERIEYLKGKRERLDNLIYKPINAMKMFIYEEYLGVGSALFALITFIVMYKNKKPYYSFALYDIIDPSNTKVTDVEVFYLGKQVSNISIIKYAFWNGGRRTIDKSDLVPAEPIKLLLKQGIILNVKTDSTLNKANDFKYIVSDDLTEVDIYFEYLDKNDGIVLDIINTCKNSDDIICSGMIKGCGAIRKRPYSIRPPLSNMAKLGLAIIQLITLLFITYKYVNYGNITTLDYIFLATTSLVVLLLFITTMKSLPAKYNLTLEKIRA